MAMNYFPVFIFTFLLVLSTSCDETFNEVDPPTDPLIDREIAESQDYNLTTPLYGMQVAIDNRVDSGKQSILDLLDNRATQFLDCQFAEGSKLGFEGVMLDDGSTIPPLPELRVYVVPNRFECDAVGLSVCSGVYFPGGDIGTDIIVLSEGGFLGCGEFSVWRHELGHRYGMLADHSNQSDFQSCIGQDNCELIDILDIEIEGIN
jgi:hypothetical protein